MVKSLLTLLSQWREKLYAAHVQALVELLDEEPDMWTVRPYIFSMCIRSACVEVWLGDRSGLLAVRRISDGKYIELNRFETFLLKRAAKRHIKLYWSRKRG